MKRCLKESSGHHKLVVDEALGGQPIARLHLMESSEEAIWAYADGRDGLGHNGPKEELNLVQRIISASVGAVLTSLLVTPLDVVKTRMQAQAQQLMCLEATSAASCPRCTHYAFHNGLMDVMLPKSLNHSMFNCPQTFTGTFDAMYKITKYEGFTSLYNGLRPSLIMAVPSTVLYFATYDKLRDFLMEKEYGPQLSPLLAGTSSRTLAATVIAPLELARTKIQAVNSPPSMLRVVSTQVRNAGFFSLWQGLSPTLFRDVPFSAVYWVSVENLKPVFRPYVSPRTDACARDRGDGSSLEEFVVSFLAGATGGMVAATLTNPFDVVKTRKQVLDYATGAPEAVDKANNNNLAIMRRIYAKEGVKGFFVGLVPRLGKIMPACAIMLSSYEAGKKYFLNH